VPSDYRALGLHLYVGGNDGNNTVIPNAFGRRPEQLPNVFQRAGTQGLALAQASLRYRLPFRVWEI
jgi:hypothetical protein